MLTDVPINCFPTFYNGYTVVTFSLVFIRRHFEAPQRWILTDCWWGPYTFVILSLSICGCWGQHRTDSVRQVHGDGDTCLLFRFYRTPDDYCVWGKWNFVQEKKVFGFSRRKQPHCKYYFGDHRNYLFSISWRPYI